MSFMRTDNDLKTRIHQRLQQVGLTANAASLLAGKSRYFVRSIIQGKKPSGEGLLRLAAVLQVPPEFFLPDFNGGLDDPRDLPPHLIPERYLKAARDLMELDEGRAESLIREIEHLAEANRARRERGD